MTTRLILVEDHPIVVDGLRAAFREHPEVEIVGQAGSLRDGRVLIAATPCDVVLLDLRLPDGSGIQLLQETRQADDPPYVSRALELPDA